MIKFAFRKMGVREKRPPEQVRGLLLIDTVIVTVKQMLQSKYIWELTGNAESGPTLGTRTERRDFGGIRREHGGLKRAVGY